MQPLSENPRVNDLMDLLAIQTKKLSRLLSEKKIFSTEYEECKNAIRSLTQEMEKRRNGPHSNYYSGKAS